jgi:ribosomal protein L34E
VAKRASDEELIFNILSILKDKWEVVGELNFLNLLALRNSRPSPRRFRRLIFRIPEISVNIKYSGRRYGKLKECPICGSKLKAVRLLNLQGKKKVVGYRCEVCHYSSESDGKPYIYTFRLKNRDI